MTCSTRTEAEEKKELVGGGEPKGRGVKGSTRGQERQVAGDQWEQFAFTPRDWRNSTDSGLVI